MDQSSLPALRELHVSRRARERYGFDETLFSFDGRVIFADFHQAREFAQRINEAGGLAGHPETWVKAGELNAMGLIDELLHVLLARYRTEVRPGVMAEALQRLHESFGDAELDRLLLTFIDEFPPLTVYRGELDAKQYLADEQYRQAALEELLLLWLANSNPAFAPYSELFDDRRLREATVYTQAVETLGGFFDGQPSMGEAPGSLLDLLQAPMRAAPNSLGSQLQYIREVWGEWLGDAVRRLLGGLDLIAEESRPFFPPGPGPVEVPVYPARGAEDEGEGPEAYSSDLDWMPRLVLLAKNAYVWLEQLSRSHGEKITTLDQVPDRELDILAQWGITGMWLIGVWQRSTASLRIKHRMGDHDAVASAYSLEDYRIADDLGGEAAFDQLKERAWKRGIRMATDMVPNHVGLDSRWVIQHPEWFVGVDHPPFPTYSFNGPDLCDDQRVGIYLEDHYWDRSDAAVVFKRRDHWTGSERYIYHGNDGTSMPWNDTAQLDYRNPEVREAVIQTILHVARRSPVIRFDAAMTLARRQYQRLWFPEPGSGGDIPSRAEHAMSRDDFDAAMPVEFWREVVDRVAAEAPDTLLLAEAFWMLEGYFVRTLGMHRVYNSAFMNMLREERNAEYRQLIKSTLEYDPQILKRYVNFMSNPDEETAVAAFGLDDKYFGVATMMVTLPGLPMFGHGQVEGFAEKYGMEFRRARWQEEPDAGLMLRHQQQIFPLLRRRHVFADVESFLLYDLVSDDGSVDENVFAYSNRSGDERALVVYNNRFGDSRGWLRLSTAVRSDGSEDPLVRRSLADGLGIRGEAGRFLILHDLVSGEQCLRSCREVVERGLWMELWAYGLAVYLDLREVVDDEGGRYAELCARLAGASVADVDQAVRELDLAPLLATLRRVLTPTLMADLLAASGGEVVPLLESLGAVYAEMLEDSAEWLGVEIDAEMINAGVRRELASVIEGWQDTGKDSDEEDPSDEVEQQLRISLLAWILTRSLGRLWEPPAGEPERVDFFDHWLLETVVAEACAGLAGEAALAEGIGRLVHLMVAAEGPLGRQASASNTIADLAEVLASEAGRLFLGVNRFAGETWFNAEAMERLVAAWRKVVWVVAADAGRPVADAALDRLEAAVESSACRFQALLDQLTTEPNQR